MVVLCEPCNEKVLQSCFCLRAVTHRDRLAQSWSRVWLLEATGHFDLWLGTLGTCNQSLNCTYSVVLGGDHVGKWLWQWHRIQTRLREMKNSCLKPTYVTWWLLKSRSFFWTNDLANVVGRKKFWPVIDFKLFVTNSNEYISDPL